MRILLANPNTSQSMAELMLKQARQVASADTHIDSCSTAFGSAYISTRSEAAIAGHALLDALAKHYDRHDAIIVGAFIVPGVTAAAKELMPVPLIATGEAALSAACLLGERFSILSIGAPARKMTDELVHHCGLSSRLASIRPLSFSGTELTERQQDADAEAIRLAQQCVDEDLADVIILGAGSMEGMAERIQPSVPVPVLSPVSFAVGMAEMLVKNGIGKSQKGRYQSPGPSPLTHISPELAGYFK